MCKEDEPTIVLVHGAGHTATIWRETQSFLPQHHLAVNLPGRCGNPGDLAGMTVALAARSVAHDIAAATNGDVILVGHSISGTILPSVATQLPDQVRHLVFVAGITAEPGQLPADVFAPGQAEAFSSMLAHLRTTYAGLTYEELERKAAHQLDSLNLSCEPMDWAGVPSSLARTFVRSERDELQPRHVQDALIAACGAQRVVDIDSNHTPATDAPGRLAAILTEIAGDLKADGQPNGRAVQSFPPGS